MLVGGAPGASGKVHTDAPDLWLPVPVCQCVYVSGEESERQIKLRAERLKVGGEGLYLLSETSLDNLVDAVHELKPDILIVDSTQTLYHGDLSASPGSVSQVKECTMALMQLAKGRGSPFCSSAT